MTAGGLDEAIGKLDGLIVDMEAEAGGEVPPLRFDPNDPWAGERSLPPEYVVKVRCPKSGYLMTKPFEAQCPMPDAFVKDNSYLRGMLKPVVKPANQQVASTSGGKPGGKGGDGKKKAVAVGTVEDFTKVLFKVAKVINCEKHPNSDKLLICTLHIGNGETRQVVAGLQKYIPVSELENVLVICVANLKKAKLAGTPSEAMILASEFADSSGVDGRAVKTLVPPAGANPGDVVFLEGMEVPGAFAKQVSSKVWEKVAAGLKVKAGLAHFADKAFCLPTGKVAIPGAPEGAGIR
uniref:tRNA-binding domain-containing protein n=1 Tax=Chloropicon laureae TaxID=464258 RepID=A0A7S2Z3B3_9CHLO